MRVQHDTFLKIKNKFPKVLVYILGLFFLSRIILTLIGVYTIDNPDAFNVKLASEFFSKSRILNIWGRNDSQYYVHISKVGYSTQEGPHGTANYAFFPMYPILIGLISQVTKIDNYYVALLISNLAFLGASIMFYKLVRIDADEKEALRAVKYLYLLPVAFLFSSALTESLFLFLLLTTFYFARKNKWGFVGIVGFFLALTRPLGIIVILPLVAEFLDSETGTKIIHKFKALIALILIPLGFGTYADYVSRLTGNPLAVFKVQEGWGRHFISNPIFLMVNTMFFISFTNYYYSFTSIYALVFLVLVIMSFDKIRSSYWILAITLMLIPMSTGLQSILRLSLPIFPIYIILAKFTKNEWLDQALTISLALLQGALMVAWIAGSALTI